MFLWRLFTKLRLFYFCYSLLVVRRKVVENSTVVIRARLTERKDRKLFMAATMEDRHGVVLADAQSLFIVPKQ